MNKKLSLAGSDNFEKISKYRYYSYKNDHKLSSYNNNKNSGLYWFTFYMYFNKRFNTEIKRIPEDERLVLISKIHDAPKDESNKISQKINNINKFSIEACRNIDEGDFYED